MDFRPRFSYPIAIALVAVFLISTGSTPARAASFGNYVAPFQSLATTFEAGFAQLVALVQPHHTVTIKISPALWRATGNAESAATFNSVVATTQPAASPTVVQIDTAPKTSAPSVVHTVSVVTASGISPAPTANLSGYVTQQELSAQLSDITASMHNLIYNQNAESTSSLYASLWGAIALSQRIDSLPSTVTVGGSTVVTQASLPALSGISGLLGISQGGTGITAAPAYGQILVGDGSGNYTLVATSSLGLAGAGSSPWALSGSNISYGTGNVGIGTTSASALLTIDSSSTTGTVLRISNSSTGGHIYDLLETGSANTGGAGRLDFFDTTAGAARLSITANGNVGIGTTSPSATFAVAGNAYISGVMSLTTPLAISSGGIGTTSITGLTSSLQFSQATSSSVARSLTGKLSDTISVKDFGAAGNTLTYKDGNLTTGLNALSSASATFTPADVGKTIWIDYAGSGTTPLQTTITGFVDAHDVTLGANAVTTVPFSFLFGAFVATPQSGLGSYTPGDTITLSGGTASVPAVITVDRTQVTTATLVSGGTGGSTTSGASSGSCVVTGTTGSGERKFSLNVALAAGIITSITSIASNGQYSANPASLAAESVTGCGSLSGATVSLVMGVLMPIITTPGTYSTTATTLTQSSTSGSGTGATFTPSFVTGGTFTYGSDDTQAWTNAINYEMQLDQSGTPACLYAPGGIYLITRSLPTFTTNGCITGAGQNKSYLAPAPSLSGDLLSWSDAWADGISKFGNPNYVTSQEKTGPTIEGIGIAGDLTATNMQNAIAFRDREDNINLNNVEIDNMHGSCMTTGYTKNTTQSFIRESTIENFRCYNSGTTNNPAVDMLSTGGGITNNEIEMDNIDIYAPNGPGLAIRGGGGQIRIGNLRIEGQEGDPQLTAGDLLDIGSASYSGIENNITIDNLELVNPYLGYAALRMAADTSTDMPYYISVLSGHLTAPSADAFGRGIEIDAGRNSSFKFTQIQSNDYNVYIGASPLVGTNILISNNGNESSLYAHIDSTSVKSVTLPSTFQTLASLVSGGMNNISSGFGALASVTTGSNNTAFGFNAGTAMTSGVQNIFLGAFAGQTHSSGSGNTYVGYDAGQADTVASGNTCIGGNACFQNTSGSQNIALGSAAGYKLAFGSLANIIIGLGNATDINQPQTDKDTIIIGNQLSALPNNAFARLDIGNLIFGTGIASTSVVSSGNIGIGTTTAYSRLTVWGTDAASSTLSFNVVNNASTTVFAVFNGGNAQLSGTLTQSSDRRLKNNIVNLDASSSLAAINALDPVAYDWLDPEKGGVRQYGFIAQQVQQVFPNLVSTTSATALTPDGTLGLNYLGLIAPLVEAVQTLSSQVSNLASTVAGFAQSFTSDKVTTKEICVEKSDGSTVCVSGDQLAEALSGGSSTPQVQLSTPTPPVILGTSTPPSIKIQGSNPATINVGDTYTDLGAIVTDNQGNTLGYKTFLNGTLVSNIVIDTSQVATDTIDYVATDTWGNTSTSTRTVVIEASPSIVPTNEASTTASTTP
jgi:Chaperone of endosialidase/Domain of unknown function (DUF5011)